MIDSESFFARYLKHSQSDQRILKSEANKHTFLMEQNNNATVAGASIKSLLKSSFEIAESLRSQNALDLQIQYQLRKFKNDYENVSEFVKSKQFESLDNQQQDAQIQNLKHIISQLQEKCQHRKFCLKQLNDLIDQKDQQIAELSTQDSELFKELFSTIYNFRQYNQIFEMLTHNNKHEMIQKINLMLAQDIENSSEYTKLSLQIGVDKIGEYINSKDEFINELQQENEELKQQIQQYIQIIESQESEVQSIQNQLSTNVRVLESFKEQILGLEQTIVKSEEKNKMVTQKWKQSESEVKNLIEQSNLKEYELETQINQYRSHLSRKEDQLNEQQEHIITIRDRSNNQDQEIRELQDTLEQVLQIKSDIESRETNLLKELDCVKQENIAQLNQSQILQNLIQDQQLNFQESETLNFDLQCKHSQSENEVKLLNFKIKQLEGQIQISNENYETMKQHFKTELTVKEEELKKQILEITCDKDEKIYTQSSQIIELEELLDDLKSEISKYEQNTMHDKYQSQTQFQITLQEKLKLLEKKDQFIQELETTINQYQSQMAQFDDSEQNFETINKELKQQIDVLKNNLQILQQDLQQSTSQIKTLEQEIIDKREEQAKHTQTISEFTEEFTKLKEQSLQSQCMVSQQNETQQANILTIKMQAEQLTDLSESITSYNKLAEELKNQVQQYKQSYDQQYEKNILLESQRQNLITEQSLLNTDHQQLKIKNQDLSQQLEQFQHKYSELNTSYILMEQQTSNLQTQQSLALVLNEQVQIQLKENTEFKEQIIYYQEELIQSEQEVQKLQHQINSQIKVQKLSDLKISEFQQQIQEKEEQIQMLNQTCKQNQSQIKQINDQYKQTQQTNQSEQSSLKQELQVKDHKINQAQQEIDNFKKQLKIQSYQLSDLSDSLQQIQESHSRLEQNNLLLRSQVQKTALEQSGISADNEQLENENQQLSQQLKEMKQNFHEMKMSFAAVEQEKYFLSEQVLSISNQNIQSLENSTIEYQTKIQKLKNHIQQQNDEIKQHIQNMSDKEHTFAQTIKQYHQKHQEHNTKLQEAQQQIKQRTDEVAKLKRALEETSINNQLTKMKDDNYKKLLGRIIKTIDPFYDCKTESFEQLLETGVLKVQQLVKSAKVPSKENTYVSTKEDKAPFNLEISRIKTNS